jgi:hypothetical protein
MALLQEYRMIYIRKIEESFIWKSTQKRRFMEVVREANREEETNEFLIECIKEHRSAEDAADDYIASLEYSVIELMKEHKPEYNIKEMIERAKGK